MLSFRKKISSDVRERKSSRGLRVYVDSVILEEETWELRFEGGEEVSFV